MTFYLYEGDVRNEEYAADSVLGVLRRIAESYKPGIVERQFAGDLILYSESDWQDLLDDFRDDEEDSGGFSRFLKRTGAPQHVPDDMLLMYVRAFPLDGPSDLDPRETYRLIPHSPSPAEVADAFDEVLPDFGYRIREGVL